MRAAAPLLAAFLLAAFLGGCGALDVRAARSPFGTLIGMSVADLLSCAGRPDSAQQTGPDTATLQYTRKDTSTGIKATLTVLGSIEIGGGGGCTAVFTVLREGTVAGVAFPQSYADGLFAAPYAACAPLVGECLAHPDRTSAPPGYDAFAYLLKDRGP